MSAAYSVIKNLYKKGFEFLGAGCYSAVFQSNVEDTVIKIGADIFDPYLHYIQSVSSTGNKHFPSIKKLYIDSDSGYYIAYIEKLVTMNLKDVDNYQEIYDWLINDTKKPTWVDSDLSCAADTLLSLTDYRNYAEIVHDKAWSSVSYDATRLDLHESNIMYRKDGTIVFSDPLCNYKMYDIPEVEEWMNHELGTALY